MHIPDGFIANNINLATYAIATGVGVVALRKARQSLGEQQVPLLGMTAAFVFAAQMINFPVAAGTSGHFMGAMLAAIMLGPWNGFLVMALVLAVQCLMFADGGLTALGTNLFNMGIVGGMGCYGLFVIMRRLLPDTRGAFLAAAAIASWCSIMLAAGACAVELALSGTSPLHIVLPTMLGVHTLIGVGEALITTTVISFILAARPDMVGAWNHANRQLAMQEI